jgi:hypothetical protein
MTESSGNGCQDCVFSRVISVVLVNNMSAPSAANRREIRPDKIRFSIPSGDVVVLQYLGLQFPCLTSAIEHRILLTRPRSRTGDLPYAMTQ